jgi:hypothetical protein
LTGGDQGQALIDRGEASGFLTLQAEDAQEMVVCEQGNSELTASIGKAG